MLFGYSYDMCLKLAIIKWAFKNEPVQDFGQRIHGP